MLIPSVLATDRMGQPPQRLQRKGEHAGLTKTHELSAVRYSLDGAPFGRLIWRLDGAGPYQSRTCNIDMVQKADTKTWLGFRRGGPGYFALAWSH